MTLPIPPKAAGVKRVLWLQTQPEHYFNCMMDDLQRNADAFAAAGHAPLQYIAGFSYKGPGWYKDNLPLLAPSILLTPAPGKGDAPPAMRDRFHADWKRELLPLQFDAAIVSGYGYRTHRELITWCHKNRIPIAMFSDSNIRSQRGRSLKLRLKRALKRRLLRPYIRRCDFLLTANRLGVAYWRYYGAPANKIVMCPYYADYARGRLAAQRPRAEVLARIPLPPDARFLFTAARLIPAKGIDLLIAAIHKLAADHALLPVHLVIAGVGPEEANLKALAGNRLGKSIHFIGFQQPADNLALMAHADAFVLPSRYEPHGIVVPEALSVGTPVIASDVGGAAFDLVVTGRNGALFRSENVADLTAKLRALLTDPRLLPSLRPAVLDSFARWFQRTDPVRITDEIARSMLKLPPVERSAS